VRSGSHVPSAPRGGQSPLHVSPPPPALPPSSELFFPPPSPTAAGKQDAYFTVNKGMASGIVSFENKRDFETVLRTHDIQAAIARVPNAAGYYDPLVPASLEKTRTRALQGLGERPGSTGGARARVVATQRSIFGERRLHPADFAPSPGIRQLPPEYDSITGRRSASVRLMAVHEDLRKRPPFDLSVVRTSLHPYDSKVALGSAVDLRTTHYAERDEDYKVRLANAARIRPADGHYGKRSVMFRYGGLPDWARAPSVAARSGLLSAAARVPPSLADVANDTAQLSTLARKSLRQDGEQGPSVWRNQRGTDAGGSRYSPHPLATMPRGSVVGDFERARGPSPASAGPRGAGADGEALDSGLFMGQAALASARGPWPSLAGRGTGSPRQAGSPPRSPARGPDPRGQRAHGPDSLDRVSQVEVPGGATVREVLEDIRVSGRVAKGLRYDREVAGAGLPVEGETRMWKSFGERDKAGLRGGQRAEAPAFSVQRNSIDPQGPMRGRPADGFHRRGGGWAPPGEFRAEAVKRVGRTKDLARSDYLWDRGITRVVGGTGQFLMH